MVTTNRTYYEPTFKVEVLDQIKEAGAVTPVARQRGLEPSLLYSWKAKEPDIRKEARKLVIVQARAAKKNGVAKNGAAKKGAAKNGAAKNGAGKNGASKPASPLAAVEALSPDGPRLTVHALGPWLVDVVRRELPAAITPVVAEQLKALADEALEKLVDDKVAEALRGWVRKGVGS